MNCSENAIKDVAGLSKTIHEAYERYKERFNRITVYAAVCFKNRNWPENKKAVHERLDLYAQSVDDTISNIRLAYPAYCCQTECWALVKQHYAKLVQNRLDYEFAETFFNSVTRHMFNTVGVNPEFEFTAADFQIPVITDDACRVCHLYQIGNHFSFNITLIRDIFDRYKDTFTFEDPKRDIELTSNTVKKHLRETFGTTRVHNIEMVESVFYRGHAAYLIGRIRNGIQIVPLIIVLLNEPGGVVVDAVLMSEIDASILFSFTHTYFHIVVDNPIELVNFLKTIIPQKPIFEIYISLGFFKHGKSELYRALSRSFSETQEQFELAAGKPGMVMEVFTIPSFKTVFKIIKDQFDYPKHTSDDAIRDKYKVVFYHDRAGRLIDALEFYRLIFDKRLFPESLLKRLIKNAGQRIRIDGNHVIVSHAYIERRVTPLDVYLEQASEKDAIAAVIDYGWAIKELAATNIFPGDLFTKNFGVTRHGRVVFYDYDELCLLTDCQFKAIPVPRDDMEALWSEPWYAVGSNDVFPEEFRTFLYFPGKLKDVFETHHGDLFGIQFWRSIQDKINRKEHIHIFPYNPKKRFSHRHKMEKSRDQCSLSYFHDT